MIFEVENSMCTESGFGIDRYFKDTDGFGHSSGYGDVRGNGMGKGYGNSGGRGSAEQMARAMNTVMVKKQL